MAKPWWNAGRTIAAAGMAAVILGVGALGFTVGHAAADGPQQTNGTSDFGGDRTGPGGRGPGHR